MLSVLCRCFSSSSPSLLVVSSLNCLFLFFRVIFYLISPLRLFVDSRVS